MVENQCGYNDINQSNEAKEVTSDMSNMANGDFLCKFFVISEDSSLFELSCRIEFFQ